MSAIPQAITPNPHTNLLNVYIQIANKMGLQQKEKNSRNIFSYFIPGKRLAHFIYQQYNETSDGNYHYQSLLR
jgi:hypothetical protein